MSSRHPTYPHPIIAEAVCDIHFRLPETKEWKPSFAGELFKHIQDEYPEMEPVVEVGLQFEPGESYFHEHDHSSGYWFSGIDNLSSLPHATL